MESLLDFDAVHWDHEPRTSRTVPPARCCRRLVGRAFLRCLCRLHPVAHDSHSPVPHLCETLDPMMRFCFVSPAFRAHQSATELALARGDQPIKAKFALSMNLKTHTLILKGLRAS